MKTRGTSSILLSCWISQKSTERSTLSVGCHTAPMLNVSDSSGCRSGLPEKMIRKSVFAQYATLSAQPNVSWKNSDSCDGPRPICASDGARKPSPHEARNANESIGAQRSATFGLVEVPKSL